MKAAPALQLVMSPTERTRESLVDEYYRLDVQVRTFAPIRARHEKLREIMLGWFPDLPADQPTSVSGDEGLVLIGERGFERKPGNMRKVYKLFGAVKFFAACTISIKAMVAELGEAKATELLVLQQTGPRKLAALPNPGRPAKAA
jgi:hypothetical protein